MLLASCIMLAAGAARSHAQVVRGTVADSATTRLLDSSWVSLIGSDGRIVDRVLTDSNGQFALSARGPGRHVVQLERRGYRTVRTEPLALEDRAEVSLSLLLAAEAAELAPVTVTAEAIADAAYLARSGYTERKRVGQGVYLDGAKLVERRSRARDFADMLRVLPGVSTIALGGDNSIVRLRGTGSIARPCRLPLMYLDGMLIAGNDHSMSLEQLGRDLQSVIHLDHLLAIEVYRGPSEVPSEYGGAESGCGVVLVWTRHSSR